MFTQHCIYNDRFVQTTAIGTAINHVARLVVASAVCWGALAHASEARRPAPQPPAPPVLPGQTDEDDWGAQAMNRSGPRVQPGSIVIYEDGSVYAGDGASRKLIGKAGLVHEGRGNQREAHWSYEDITRRAPSTLDSLQFGYKQRKLDEVQKPSTVSRFLPGGQTHTESATEREVPAIAPNSVRKAPLKKFPPKSTGMKLTLLPAETLTTRLPELVAELTDAGGTDPENAIAAYSAIIDNTAQPLEVRQEARKARGAASLVRGTKSDINNALIDLKAAGLPGIQLTIRAASAEMKVVTEVTGWLRQNQSVLVTQIQGDWLWVASVDGSDKVKGYITMEAVLAQAAQPQQQVTVMTPQQQQEQWYQQQWYQQQQNQQYNHQQSGSGPKSIWETPEWETPAQIREGRRNGTLK